MNETSQQTPQVFQVEPLESIIAPSFWTRIRDAVVDAFEAIFKAKIVTILTNIIFGGGGGGGGGQVHSK